MISWIRRARLIVPVAAVALVATACVNFTGTKVITGEGTPTGDFVVRITCQIGDQTVTEDLTFSGEETQSSDEFIFGPTLGEGTCTIVEIEQAGATSVTYQCGEVEFDAVEAAIPGDAGATKTAGAFGGPGTSLAIGQGPVTCTETPDGLEIDVDIFQPGTVNVSFTVINDFAVTPPTTLAPTTTTLEPAPAEAAAPPPAPVPTRVVTFTG